MIYWSAFLGTIFSGLSDVLECSGALQMKVVWIDNYPPGWKSLHDWSEGWAIKLTTVCDI